MLAPKDALCLGWDLGTVRVYYAFNQLWHRIASRMQSDISIDVVLARIAKVLPAMSARPASVEEASRFCDEAVVKASALVASGSFAERALAVGLAFADVLVLGRIADLMGLLLVLEPPVPKYRDRLDETKPRLGSARETCVAALQRFAAGLEHEQVAPDVLDAAHELRRRVDATPPPFDAPDAAHTWRPGDRWWKGLEAAMGDLLRSLSVPVTDAPKAEAIRTLGADVVEVKNGVVEKLEIPAHLYLLAWRTIRETATVRRIRLTSARPHLDALVSSGALEGLCWVDLVGEELDDADIAKIAAAPTLASVRALGLGRNRISNAGVREIWASPILAKLAYCGLEGNPCSDLADRELTPEEYSRYEWIPTDHARALAKELGSRRWPVPWGYHWPPEVDDVIDE